MAIVSVNPATGQTNRVFTATPPSEIDARLTRAGKAFATWRETTRDHRADLIRNLADKLREKTVDLASLATREMGKPIKEARAEVEKCAWVCEFFAEHAEMILQTRKTGTDAAKSYVRYDPLGPILAIMPWNFPYWQVFRFAIPALIAGNVGVLKHASNVPECSLAIVEIFKEAGFPPDTFQSLLISAKTANQVIADRRIAAVTLTGSDIAGRNVAMAASGGIKKCVLELGGSDPFIVLPDVDVAKAAEVGAIARTINSGQSCIAAKRFIVHQDIAEDFTEALREQLAARVIGDPTREETDIGPLARIDLRHELHRQVGESVGEGARVILGGEIPEGDGFFYPVTLLRDVKPWMVVAREETFGPVAPVIVVTDEDEAVRVANDSVYGLGASVWTGDRARGEALAGRLEAGAVFVNGMVKSDPRLPFGGIKRSGFGRELAAEGVREFTNVKSVWIG